MLKYQNLSSGKGNLCNHYVLANKITYRTYYYYHYCYYYAGNLPHAVPCRVTWLGNPPSQLLFKNTHTLFVHVTRRDASLRTNTRTPQVQ